MLAPNQARDFVLLSTLILLPLQTGAVYAASTFNFGSVSCSGAQTTSPEGIASFSCSGDFSLSDGSITSDAEVHLSADGALTLNNIRIKAPIINLFGATGIALNGDTHLDASGFPAPGKIFLIVGAGGQAKIGPSSILNVRGGDEIRYTGGTIQRPPAGGGITIRVNGGGLTPSPAVPIPAAWIMLSSALTGLVAIRKRKPAQASLGI